MTHTSHTSFNDLPHDICDRILTLLPDFLSLQHSVLSLKHFCDTFASRKRSIMRAVVTNEVGPALPFAVALVRTMNMLGNRPLQDILEGLSNSDPDSAHRTIDVTAAEAKALSGVSATVKRLESFFCLLYKDRSATVSTLSEVEIFKFQRAMYRLWIISVLLNDSHPQSIPRGLNISFVTNMSEAELVEVREGTVFLDALFFSVMRKHMRFHGTAVQNHKPPELRLDELLAQFDGGIVPASFGTSLQRGAMAVRAGFDNHLREQQVKQLFEGKYGRRAILTNYRVEDIQTCQKCGNQTPELFGQNNWHFLHSYLDVDNLLAFLPGKLSMNGSVRITVSALYERRDSHAPTLSEMFDLENDPESGWWKSDWLCITCIQNFMREKMFTWVVSQLVKTGHQFKTNCWYGWNCRTQVHRGEHASKLNHLCEPGVRDDTGKTNNNADTNVAQPDLDANAEENIEDEYDTEDEEEDWDESEDEE